MVKKASELRSFQEELAAEKTHRTYANWSMKNLFKLESVGKSVRVRCLFCKRDFSTASALAQHRNGKSHAVFEDQIFLNSQLAAAYKEVQRQRDLKRVYKQELARQNQRNQFAQITQLIQKDPAEPQECAESVKKNDFDTIFSTFNCAKKTKEIYKNATLAFLNHRNLRLKQIVDYCQNLEGKKEITRQLNFWIGDSNNRPGKSRLLQAKAFINMLLERNGVQKLQTLDIQKLKALDSGKDLKENAFTKKEYQQLLAAIGEEPKNAWALNFVRFQYLFSTRMQDAFGIKCSLLAKEIKGDLVELPIYSKKASRTLIHFARTKDVEELQEYARNRLAQFEEYMFGPKKENVKEQFRHRFRRFIQKLELDDRLKKIFQQSHCFRRSSAQHMEEAGMKYSIIQAKLQHTQMENTLIYLKVKPEAAKISFVKALDDVEKKEDDQT